MAGIERSQVMLLILLGVTRHVVFCASNRGREPDALVYASGQMHERYGPKYPEEAFSGEVLKHAYVLQGKRPSRVYKRPGTSTDQDAIDAEAEMYFKGFAITTVASPHAMAVLVPQMLRSLHAHTYPASMQGRAAKGSIAMDSHAVIFGLNRAAHKTCQELQQKYGHACLFEVDPAVKDFSNKEAHAGQLAFFALGFSKLKHILDMLSAGVDVLYLDADVIVQSDPRVTLDSLLADIVVGAQPPCGPGSISGMVQATVTGHRHLSASGATSKGHDVGPLSANPALQRAQKFVTDLEQPGFNPLKDGVPADTSAIFLTAKASVTRCIQRALNDLKHRAGNATFRSELGLVWEAASFASTVPLCAHTFGIQVASWDEAAYGVVCRPSQCTASETSSQQEHTSTLLHVRSQEDFVSRAACAKSLRGQGKD